VRHSSAARVTYFDGAQQGRKTGSAAQCNDVEAAQVTLRLERGLLQANAPDPEIGDTSTAEESPPIMPRNWSRFESAAVPSFSG